MMKNLFLWIMKSYVSLGLFFYYKKITVYGRENIPADKPLLLLPNHQNALLDALLVATRIDGYSYYLTRANVFNNRVVAKLLEWLRLIPVYRIRDGYASLTKNTEIFECCSHLLSANQSVLIFPEGNHNIRRSVRPLSKGFTRLVFRTLEEFPDSDLKLMPIGLNYVKADACPDSALILFGKPIDARLYGENNNDSILKMRNDVHAAISELTTHIPMTNYQETLSRLEDIDADFLDPVSVNKSIETGIKNVEDAIKTKRTTNNSASKLVKPLLILNLLLPYMIWKFWLKPGIKEVEFVSTLRFALAISLVPLYLLLVGLVIAMLCGITSAIVYLILVLLLDLLYVKL